MTQLHTIPGNYNELDENGLIGETDDLHDIEQVDQQLAIHGLEVVWFENGEYINWYINKYP